MTDPKIVYQGDAQLVRWADGNSQGPTITLRLPESDDLGPFRGATMRKGDKAGQLYAIVIVEVGVDGSGDAVEEHKAPAASSEKGPHGEFWRHLHQFGWFYNPAVWKAVGSDEQFREWIRTQPCAARRLDTNYMCVGDVVAAHVRRVANGAGTGIKPPYSAIPLCDNHHQLQHKMGEEAMGGKEWFDKQRGEHLAAWVKSRIYTMMNTDSLTKISPLEFGVFCDSLGIRHTLPRSVQ